MSHPLTSWTIPNATSSQALQSGPTPCDKRVGPMTDPYGPDPRLANLSARQAKALGLLTSGTFGHTSTTSSASAALSRSLVSKLKLRLSTAGSTLFKLTWKELVTPSGRQVCLLRGSARPTSVTGFTGWPTPAVMDTLPPRSDEKLARAKSVAGCSNLKDILPVPSYAGMERSVRVNPALSRGLMNLPECWDACAPTAMPSTLKRRKLSLSA